MPKLKNLEDDNFLTPEAIHDACAKIVQAIDPEKVIVFGSVARNQSERTSDLDILVVVRGSRDKDCRDIARRIDTVLFGRRFGMDIIVRTDQQIDYLLQRGNSFYANNVFREGKVLYDKAGRR